MKDLIKKVSGIYLLRKSNNINESQNFFLYNNFCNRAK